MTLSKPRQRNAVSEGIALGLVMCGREDFEAPRENKSSLDLALGHAWRNWPYAMRFPQAGFHNFKPGSRDPSAEMCHATYRNQTFAMYWEDRTIHARPTFIDDFDPGEVATFIDGEVPVDGWHDLAQRRLGRLRPQEHE
jgi:hypothetical protein